MCGVGDREVVDWSIALLPLGHPLQQVGFAVPALGP